MRGKSVFSKWVLMLSMALVSSLLSARAAPAKPLVYFDLQACLASLPEDSVLKYDTVKFIASLQGVVNRHEPRLIVRFLEGSNHEGKRINLDDYWFELLQTGWLKDREVTQLTDFDALCDLFKDDMTGAVVWDPAVPATANVAATVCGVEGWLPVRADSALYDKVVKSGPQLPVKLSLAGMFDGTKSGSVKCDAYLWAKEQYLDTGQCNPALMAYYIDAYTQRPGEPGFHYPDLFNATLTNHDYYIARRAFFFDLGPWHDESPVDDPGQPAGTDRKTLFTLMEAANDQTQAKEIITVGGFVPWNLKYTNHGPAGGTHEPVPTEWEYAAILSAHNAIMDADALGLACLTNASAYVHHPLKRKYRQNKPPDAPPLENKTYVLIYMGDYDSAAWLSTHIPQVWDDPGRGSIPMAWAFNPNLADRVPYVFDHVYTTKTPNDWFIGGDSGAGYLNPNLLIGDRLGSGLPDALELWVDFNERYYRRFGYSITGFVINGFHGDMPLRIQEAYARFSPVGVGMQLGFEQPLVDGTPFIRHNSDIYPKLGNLDATMEQLAGFAKPDKPQFLVFRMILQKPSTVAALYEGLKATHSEQNWEFCDPYTFFALYKQSLKAR